LTGEYLLDTNILIYYTKGYHDIKSFIDNLALRHALKISILTKIEFLGWDKHTPEGFEKCKGLIETATVYSVDENIANKAIELKRDTKIRLADAVIAATAILNKLKLVTRNTEDFKNVDELEVINIFK